MCSLTTTVPSTHAKFGGLLIELSSADCAPDPAVLHSPGGFTWFYVDLVDDQGGGATVIWSWGFPVLPGYAGAARAGRPSTPPRRPRRRSRPTSCPGMWPS